MYDLTGNLELLPSNRIDCAVAPESFANYSVQHKVKTNIAPTADIWALGAVFSDVLVWSICGERGREEYRLKRQAEIASQQHLKERGIDACFHDMVERLESVQESHDWALDNRRWKDDVSAGLSELILKFMLVSHEERLTAMQIRPRADKILKGIQSSPTDRNGLPSGHNSTERSMNGDHTTSVLPRTSPHDRTEMVIQAVPSQGRDYDSKEPWYTDPDPAFDEPRTPSVPEIQPPAKAAEEPIESDQVVTIETVYALMQTPSRTRSMLYPLVHRPDKATVIMSLPGMEDARRKIEAHNGRDQVCCDGLSIAVLSDQLYLPLADHDHR